MRTNTRHTRLLRQSVYSQIEAEHAHNEARVKAQPQPIVVPGERDPMAIARAVSKALQAIR